LFFKTFLLALRKQFEKSRYFKRKNYKKKQNLFGSTI